MRSPAAIKAQVEGSGTGLRSAGVLSTRGRIDCACRVESPNIPDKITAVRCDFMPLILPGSRSDAQACRPFEALFYFFDRFLTVKKEQESEPLEMSERRAGNGIGS